MSVNRSTFFAILVIGALIVYLYSTGALNNASNLTAILLFGVFALAFALEFDIFELRKTPQMPTEVIKVKETTI